jgi:hypothetical protein
MLEAVRHHKLTGHSPKLQIEPIHGLLQPGRHPHLTNNLTFLTNPRTVPEHPDGPQLLHLARHPETSREPVGPNAEDVPDGQQRPEEGRGRVQQCDRA